MISKKFSCKKLQKNTILLLRQNQHQTIKFGSYVSFLIIGNVISYPIWQFSQKTNCKLYVHVYFPKNIVFNS